MMNEKISKIANDLFDKVHSNLETPITGYVFTPVCQACIYSEYHYGTWKEPECHIYGRIPEEYESAKTQKCPHYKNDPNSNHIPFTEEDV